MVFSYRKQKNKIVKLKKKFSFREPHLDAAFLPGFFGGYIIFQTNSFHKNLRGWEDWLLFLKGTWGVAGGSGGRERLWQVDEGETALEIHCVKEEKNKNIIK